MKEKMVEIEITLPDYIIKKIDELRIPLKMSRSKYIVMILEKYIKKDKEHLQELHITDVIYFCDKCKKTLKNTLPITVTYNYGSKKDGEQEHFCSDKCFKEWCRR